MPGTQDDKTQLDPAVTRLIQDEIDRRVEGWVRTSKLILAIVAGLVGALVVTPISAMLASKDVSDFAFELIGQRIDERVESFLKAKRGDPHIYASVETYLKEQKGDPHFKTFLNKAVAYSYSGYSRLDPDNPFLFLRFYKSEEDSAELKCRANFRDKENARRVKQIDIHLNDKREVFKILKVDMNFDQMVVNKNIDLSLKPQDMFDDTPEPWHELRIKLVVDDGYWKPVSQPGFGGIANMVTNAGEPPAPQQSVYVDISCVVAVYGAALYDRVAKSQ